MTQNSYEALVTRERWEFSFQTRRWKFITFSFRVKKENRCPENRIGKNIFRIVAKNSNADANE